MTLIFQLASVLHRILIRAKNSLQFPPSTLGVSLSLRMAKALSLTNWSFLCS